MGVGASDAEAVDTDDDLARLGKRLQSAHDLYVELVPGDLGVDGVDVDARRQGAVLQSERHLDDRGHTCGGLHVADVGLERAGEHGVVGG